MVRSSQSQKHHSPLPCLAYHNPDPNATTLKDESHSVAKRAEQSRSSMRFDDVQHKVVFLSEMTMLVGVEVRETKKEHPLEYVKRINMR